VRLDSRLRIAAVALVGVLLGAAIHGWLHRGGPTQDAPASRVTSLPGDVVERVESLAAEVAELQSALDEERSRRGALEIEMALRRREIGADASSELPGVPSPGGESATGHGGDPEVDRKKAHKAATARQRAWFDAAALRQRGIDERHTEWLREHFEELQMKELYLRDQATREGWIGRPSFRMQMQAMRKESRETLGVEDYDLLLYASGHNNRVLIRDVLQSSPAAAAGIESGDVILRYDDAAILAPNELTSATSQGKPGSSVAVDVMRNGTQQRFYLPRGPLGVRIVGVRRFPAAAP